MAPHDEPTTAPTPSGRLVSVDALRGFDMFWIAGGEEVARAWAAHANGPVRQWVDDQLEHVPWEGFRFYDLIFPLFLFLVGVVIPFSLGRMSERGEPRARLYRRVLRRTAALFLLGLVYNGFLQTDFSRLAHGDFSEVRFAGVLQRIAVCYLVAAVVVLNTRPRTQVLLLIALLAGYWALLAYVPAPGSRPADYSPGGNLAGYVDRHWLPGKILDKYYGFGDNEGYLSTLPSVATALLGVLAGHWLRAGRGPWAKAVGLALAGLVCLAAGYAWGELAPPEFRFPVIKHIWTSSFVLYAGGWSLLSLALFYTVIDVLGLRAWAFFFVVIGVNAITIYVGQHLIDFHYTAHALLGGVETSAGGFDPAVWATADFLVKWLFLLFLYRNKLFLRV